MKETKKRYNKQCKMKTITFYKHDADLLAFANSINFQLFVKDMLEVVKIMDKNGHHDKIMEAWAKKGQ
jgi:hypothetical protein